MTEKFKSSLGEQQSGKKQDSLEFKNVQTF